MTTHTSAARATRCVRSMRTPPDRRRPRGSMQPAACHYHARPPGATAMQIALEEQSRDERDRAVRKHLGSFCAAWLAGCIDSLAAASDVEITRRPCAVVGRSRRLNRKRGAGWSAARRSPLPNKGEERLLEIRRRCHLVETVTDPVRLLYFLAFAAPSRAARQRACHSRAAT